MLKNLKKQKNEILVSAEACACQFQLRRVFEIFVSAKGQCERKCERETLTVKNWAYQLFYLNTKNKHHKRPKELHLFKVDLKLKNKK